MDKRTFLEKYNILEEDFNKTNLQWNELIDIYNDLKSISEELEFAGDFISNCLKRVDTVHSVRQRIKDPEHLVEKIIRKKLKNLDREITLENYTEQITDLIGIRVIHLFKEEWENIHEFIAKKWKLVEDPTANIRKGDSEELINKFKEKGCETKYHKYGYRSIHYIIELQPNKRKFIAEIQVRTIFEEGWSEIDHRIRYPYDIDNAILANYLVMFNRLAGSADEMGSFVNFLGNELKNINETHCKELEEKNELINDLKTTIDELEIEKGEKDKIQKKFDFLQKQFSLHDIEYPSKDNYKNKIYTKALIEAMTKRNEKRIKVSIRDNKYCIKRIVE